MAQLTQPPEYPEYPEYIVVLSGEVTSEYEGGLYRIIDSYNLEADRDAVIDVFDVVGYYTEDVLQKTITRWVELLLELTGLTGLHNVSLNVELNTERRRR